MMVSVGLLYSVHMVNGLDTNGKMSFETGLLLEI